VFSVFVVGRIISPSFRDRQLKVVRNGGESPDHLARLDQGSVRCLRDIYCLGCTPGRRRQSELLTRQLTSTWRRRAVLADGPAALSDATFRVDRCAFSECHSQ